MAEPIDARMEALGRRIAAAREQLAKREDFEDDEIGDILETINDDYERARSEEETRARETLDRVEARLADLAPVLSVLPR
jgi:sulfite reductase beta subunit-like hemoprotein